MGFVLRADDGTMVTLDTRDDVREFMDQCRNPNNSSKLKRYNCKVYKLGEEPVYLSGSIWLVNDEDE